MQSSGKLSGMGCSKSFQYARNETKKNKNYSTNWYNRIIIILRKTLKKWFFGQKTIIILTKSRGIPKKE